MKDHLDNNLLDLFDEDERITSYLKGRMDKQEELRFIQELDSNPELKSKAIAIARLVKGLKQAGIQKDSKIQKALLSSTESDIKEVAYSVSHDNISRTISFRKIGTWLSVAASIALLVWIGTGYYNFKKTTGLGDEYARSFDTSLISRGNDDVSELESKLNLLFDNVKNGKDLDNTIHELTLYWELSNMKTYNDYTDYSSEIGYNLAIAYLKDNDKDNSVKVLEKLISITESDSEINKLSQNLIDDINKL